MLSNFRSPSQSKWLCLIITYLTQLLLLHQKDFFWYLGTVRIIYWFWDFSKLSTDAKNIGIMKLSELEINNIIILLTSWKCSVLLISSFYSCLASEIPSWILFFFSGQFWIFVTSFSSTLNVGISQKSVLSFISFPFYTLFLNCYSSLWNMPDFSNFHLQLRRLLWTTDSYMKLIIDISTWTFHRHLKLSMSKSKLLILLPKSILIPLVLPI